MTRLLAAEDVAGPADLEVRQCDLEPGPELRRVEDRLEPLARLVAQPFAAAVQEIGVRAPRAAAHPAAELVELRQPERVGTVDDDRVRVRDVEPRLDDRRAHEDIGLALGEREHHPVERALGHLPVTDHEARVGQHPAELLGLRLDRLDPVVHVEHLAAAIELAQDRVPDEPGGRLGDARLDGQAVLGRRLDERQVAHSRERQVERARDRRRRQRHDVDLAAHPLEALLGRDTEALLLVDDDQAEVAEPDVLAEQPVRPDDDVDRAVG